MSSGGFDPSSYIGPDEPLARFVLFSSHVRADGSVKPDLFIPTLNVERDTLETSSTRYDSLSDAEIWQRGEAVAAENEKELLGRSDVEAAAHRNAGLSISPDPQPNDPQHVNVVDWPNEKAAQKMLATLISENRYAKARHEISNSEAVNYIDRIVVVKGMITQARRDIKNNVILSFDSGESASALAIKIKKIAAEAFNYDPLTLKNRVISVLAKVLQTGGALQLEVNAEQQISF